MFAWVTHGAVAAGVQAKSGYSGAFGQPGWGLSHACDKFSYRREIGQHPGVRRPGADDFFCGNEKRAEGVGGIRGMRIQSQGAIVFTAKTESIRRLAGE